MYDPKSHYKKEKLFQMNTNKINVLPGHNKKVSPRATAISQKYRLTIVILNFKVYVMAKIGWKTYKRRRMQRI